MKLLSVLTAALLTVSPAAMAASLEGDWVVDSPGGFPGFTVLRLHQANGKLVGSSTSQWYGDQPLSDVRPVGETVLFKFDNGNPRLEQHDLTATLQGGVLHLTGDLWFAHLNLTAHRGGARELAAVRFKPSPLPAALHDLPDNGLARTPPMGWSSWNKFAEHIDDKTVRQVADAMVSSGLRDAGYVYINIDDGWQGARDKAGVLQPNTKFPDMKGLADYLHARGLKLGIYSSPGLKSCAGYVGSYGHVRQDAQTWARWGVDYLKYDLCSGEGFYRTAHDVRATYQMMGEALQATGRPIVFSLCEYGRFDVGKWGRKVGGNLWRTTRDISDDYASMSANGFEHAAGPADVGPGGWNDPDMLEVGNGGMTPDEYRTHMTLWAMQAAPLLTGNDVRAMDASTLELLTNRGVIAVDQDPLGKAGRRVARNGLTEVWSRPLAGGGVAVALFNRGDQPAKIEAGWNQVGISGPTRVRDVWTGRDLGPMATGITREVPAHGAVLVGLEP